MELKEKRWKPDWSLSALVPFIQISLSFLSNLSLLLFEF
jgi:hypothetical protein